MVKRSRFIGHVAPAFSTQEAESFIASIKRKHADAGHNVWAYSVGQGTPVERLSDDGEPKGTAGYPVLEVFKKRSVRNVVCVVTRYFGGILLGAGGLLRAYGQSAGTALDAAGTCVYTYYNLLEAALEYDQYGRVRRELEGRRIAIAGVDFAEDVRLRAWVRPVDVEAVQARICDLTSGKAALAVGEGKYLPAE